MDFDAQQHSSMARQLFWMAKNMPHLRSALFVLTKYVCTILILILSGILVINGLLVLMLVPVTLLTAYRVENCRTH